MSRAPRARPQRALAKGPGDVDRPGAGLEAGTSTATESMAAGHVSIDIDPVVSAGFIHDRYDLLLRGRAVSALPIEEVAVSLDGAIVGRVQFGAMEQLELGHVADISHVFHINVP